MFRKIILAFKFSSACRSALEKSIQIAVGNDAELLIFHALDYRLQEKSHQDPELVRINEQMRHKFETEIKPYLADFTNFQFGYSPTDPGMEICKIARYVNADLIILGSHQRPKKTSLGRLDYVGITIFENAPCPVMLVPHYN